MKTNQHTKTQTVMSIDYSKYSAEERIKKKEWKPPVAESVMNDKSNKLAMSTRSYPEYMLAAFAFLKEHRNTGAQSLSELVHKIICDYINTHKDEIGQLPDAETALDFLLMQGWITSENHANLVPIGKIREKQSKLQEKIDSGRATLKESYEYWKDRDPEKAEMIMQKMSQQLADSLTDVEESEEDGEPDDTTPPEQETIATDHKTEGVASLDYMDDVKTSEEDSDE